MGTVTVDAEKTETNDLPKNKTFLPAEADFICAYSTVSEHTSCRNEEKGTW